LKFGELLTILNINTGNALYPQRLMGLMGVPELRTPNISGVILRFAIPVV